MRKKIRATINNNKHVDRKLVAGAMVGTAVKSEIERKQH